MGNIDNGLQFVHVTDDDSFEIMEKKYLQALEEHPEYRADYLHAMYFLYWQYQEYENALIAIYQAIQCMRSPDDIPEYYHCLANAFRDLQKYPEAIEAMHKSAEASPFKAVSYYYLGDMYLESGNFEKAVAIFSAIVTLPLPNYEFSNEDYFLECTAYYYTEESDNILDEDYKEQRALNIYMKLLAAATTDTQRAYMHCVLSEFYMHYGHHLKAAEESEKACDLDPDNPILSFIE